MLRERFVKINGNVYYESELQMMSDNQLYNIINECKKGIDEIQRKSDDYRNVNYDSPDIVHYQEVLAKFESASVYLQSDIVLIDKILKSRNNKSKNVNITLATDTSIQDYNNYLWYKTFFEESKKGVLNRRWLKIAKNTSKKLGYSINFSN